jgi:hypothetical protein
MQTYIAWESLEAERRGCAGRGFRLNNLMQAVGTLDAVDFLSFSTRAKTPKYPSDRG